MRRKKPLHKYLKPAHVHDRHDIASIDLSGSLDGFGGKKKFLKRFDAEDLLRIFNDIGFTSYLKGIGLADIRIAVERDEYKVNYLKLYNIEESPGNLLMDLRVTEKIVNPDAGICGAGVFDGPLYMVVIEWLTLQNPFGTFDEGKPRLPGQTYPGLGALNYCFEIMYRVGSEMVKDGFMDIPDHMSGAMMYSRKFKFFDPKHEAVLHAVMRDLKGRTLRDIAWGIITETVIEEYKNAPQTYDPCEQIYATSERMKKYFSSHAYMSVYHKYYKRKKYRFDYEGMVRKREELLKIKNEADV